MIKTHEVIGSKVTVLHDFKVTTEGMKLKIDGTHYTAGNKELFKNYTEEMSTITETVWDEETQQEIEIKKQVPTGIKIPLEGANIEITAGYDYEVWLCEDGITVLSKEIGNPESHFDVVPESMIDRLAWFSVPKDTITLDEVQINVIEIREG
jgi:RNase P/RNase MRP subunit p29